MSNESLDPVSRIRALDRLLMVVDVDGVQQGAMKPGATYADIARDVGVTDRTVSRWVTGPAGKQWLTWRLAVDGGASEADAFHLATGDVRVGGPSAPGVEVSTPSPEPLANLDPIEMLLECLASALPLDDALDAAMIERAAWDEWMRLAVLPTASLEVQAMNEDQLAEAEWCRWLRKAARAAEARCKLTLLRSIITGGSSAAQLQLLGRRWREQFGITAASTGDAGEVDERPDAELDAIIAAAGAGDGPG